MFFVPLNFVHNGYGKCVEISSKNTQVLGRTQTSSDINKLNIIANIIIIYIWYKRSLINLEPRNSLFA